MLRIGFAGYSGQKFDTSKAELLIDEALDDVIARFEPTHLQVISGLTNLGIPALAYSFAVKHVAPYRKLTTVGIACSKAKDYDCYPCDRVFIIGTEWGDESEAFLASIDVLIRIGGGKQSHAECDRAKALGIPVIEKELEAL